MAGYVIHLAIGEEYIRKHKDDINDKEEFLKGTIAPDRTTDNLKAHYGEKNLVNSLKYFLEVKEKELDTDYIKGYFLHLFTDYIFYGKYFGKMHLYNDYDITNRKIIEKYNVKIPKELEQFTGFIDGEPEYLKYDLLYHIIDMVTDNTIKEIIEKIEKGDYDEHKN